MYYIAILNVASSDTVYHVQSFPLRTEASYFFFFFFNEKPNIIKHFLL